MTGYTAGILLSGILFYCIMPDEKDFVVKSPKRINPTIELTTDGKTIDTLYVYKR